MQYCKPEYIAELQKDQSLKYWRIYDSSGKTEMNNQLSDISLDNSIDLLQKDLENTSGDYVIVKLYEKKPEKNSAGNYATTGISRKVSLNPAIGKTPAGYGSQAVGIEFVMAMLTKQKDLELQMLEMKLSQESSKLDKLIDTISNPQVLTMLLGKLNGSPKAAISAPAKVATQNKATDQGDKLTSILNRFAALDPDYIGTLEKMANLAEADPNLLPGLKSAL